MPPTNTYDVTFPPDTQAANLLGQDLRNLALNVQQRMALISGTLASRWNPGGDAQPTNWTGLLFFATDTGAIYQWSGSAWVQVNLTTGSSFKYEDMSSHVFTNPASGVQTGNSVTIPTAILQVGSIVKVKARANVIFGASSFASFFYLGLGGSPNLIQQQMTANQTAELALEFTVTASAAEKGIGSLISFGTVNAVAYADTFTAASGVTINTAINIGGGGMTGTITLDYMTVSVQQ